LVSDQFIGNRFLSTGSEKIRFGPVWVCVRIGCQYAILRIYSSAGICRNRNFRYDYGSEKPKKNTSANFSDLHYIYRLVFYFDTVFMGIGFSTNYWRIESSGRSACNRRCRVIYGKICCSARCLVLFAGLDRNYRSGALFGAFCDWIGISAIQNSIAERL